jgi:hypothetical protein
MPHRVLAQVEDRCGGGGVVSAAFGSGSFRMGAKVGGPTTEKMLTEGGKFFGAATANRVALSFKEQTSQTNPKIYWNQKVSDRAAPRLTHPK